MIDTHTRTHVEYTIYYRDFKMNSTETTSRWNFSSKKEIQVRFNVHFKYRNIHGNWVRRRKLTTHTHLQLHRAKWKEITLSIKFIVNKSIEMINYYTYYFNVLSFNRLSKMLRTCVRMLLIYFFYDCCCVVFSSVLTSNHFTNSYVSSFLSHSLYLSVSYRILFKVFSLDLLIFHLCELWTLWIREWCISE